MSSPRCYLLFVGLRKVPTLLFLNPAPRLLSPRGATKLFARIDSATFSVNLNMRASIAR